MIEGLKPYSEYKESAIPWARELPVGWQTERAKRLFTKMQRPVRPEDEVVTCFRDGMVTLRKNRRLRGFTEATVAYQNELKNTPSTARIEHDKTLKRVITAMFKDDAQLFKQFQDNDSFRGWLTATVFELTALDSGVGLRGTSGPPCPIRQSSPPPRF